MALGDARPEGAPAQVRIAVDTSVLMSIFKQERAADDWFRLLLRLRAGQQLVACDVVWSEVAPLFPSLPELQIGMRRIGVDFSPLNETASFAAGEMFAAYRRRGGLRTRMIADFMIGAHALHQATGLATGDTDFAAREFPELRLLQP